MSEVQAEKKEQNPTPSPPPPGGEGEKEPPPAADVDGTSMPGSPSPSPRAAETANAGEARHAGSTAGGGRGVGAARSKRIPLAVLALVAVGFALWYFAVRTPEPKDDFGRFQGEWQLAVPTFDRDKKPAARAKPVTIRVTGDRWVYVADGKEQRRYQMTLRPEANPKEIDLVQLGTDDKPTAFVLRGIYTIDRDSAKVVTASGAEPRPTELDSEDGPPGWILERVK
jgi:uncharacterized protein (TIGR03067 family)